MITFFRSGSCPVNFHPSILRMAEPIQRVKAFPMRGVEGDRNGLSSELYGLAPRNATKTYNNGINDNLFHFKVNYSDILHFSKPIAELLDGEIQKMTLYQIP